MSRMFITEYERMAETTGGFRVAVGVEPAVAEQVVAFTGTAGVSAALNVRTRFVRIHVDGIADLLFSVAGTLAVAGASKRLAAGQTEFYGVDQPGGSTLKISAVTDT